MTTTTTHRETPAPAWATQSTPWDVDTRSHSRRFGQFGVFAHEGRGAEGDGIGAPAIMPWDDTDLECILDTDQARAAGRDLLAAADFLDEIRTGKVAGAW